ncbi:hypothetical protein HMPREF9184_01407 [Streptococcus sp. oral taxon 058 str. F0407]|nr:hypothetical protein HMPREF9184_01407 [Streptococcus sp. oral taxon 058 str. F0407]
MNLEKAYCIKLHCLVDRLFSCFGAFLGQRLILFHDICHG